MPTIRTTMATALLGLAACSDQTTAPSSAAFQPSIKFWEASATLRWNQIARDQTTLLHAGAPVSQQLGTRSLAYLSLAQYNAAVAAEHTTTTGDHPSVAAAVAGASAVVLSLFYPDQASYFDAQVAAQEAAPQWAGETHTDVAAGEALGRDIGAAVVASANTDGFTSSVAGVVIPICPGCWFSAPGKVPVFPLLGSMRPFFLTAGNQFRPGPPPAFGSAEYLAALQEVRQIADSRTAAQDALAKFWAAPGGFTAVAQAYSNQVATEEIAKFHLDERHAAHVLALANMVAMDAFIACHDAKYTYWLIRPPQADPGIVTAIPLPNHPSYPSNHSCVTGSTMAVLARLFPSDSGYLTGLADSAAISRVYGGIHYRFDTTVGLELGRTIAAYAFEHDVVGQDPYVLR
jgi:membrane-associated phospholipid phosphatase